MKYDRSVARRLLAGWILSAIGGLLFLFPSILYWAIGVLAVGLIILLFARCNRRSFYRNVLLSLLIEDAFPDLKYSPHDGITERRFRSFDLFNNFSRYHSEDRLSGVIGKTRFEAAEVHLKRKVSNDTTSTYETVFRGVVFIADFNKDFNTRTVVLPDVAERCFGKLIGNFLQRLNFSQGEAVHLEDPEFEKYFSVYSRNQVEARYLLTPKMMQNLLELRKRCPDLRVLFENSNIILVFSMSNGWLEPPLFGKLANPDVIANALREILSVLSIIEQIDLNTRIWSKQ